MPSQHNSDVQTVIANLRIEIARQKKTLGYIGTVGRPDMLTNITQHQWVNPHLPIGWPTMPKGLVAKLTAYVKKIVRRLLSWYIVPIVDQQNAYNQAVSEALASLNTNLQGLGERINALETAVSVNSILSTDPLNGSNTDSKARLNRLKRATDRYYDLLTPFAETLLITEDDGDETKSVALYSKTAPQHLFCTSLTEATNYLKDAAVGMMSIILMVPGHRDTLRELSNLINLSVGKLAEGGLLLVEIEEKPLSGRDGTHTEAVRSVVWPPVFICSIIEKAGLPHTQVRFIPRQNDEVGSLSPLSPIDTWAIVSRESSAFAAFAYKEK